MGLNSSDRTLRNTENSPKFFLIRLLSPPAPEIVPRWPLLFPITCSYYLFLLHLPRALGINMSLVLQSSPGDVWGFLFTRRRAGHVGTVHPTRAKKWTLSVESRLLAQEGPVPANEGLCRGPGY